MQRKRNGTRRWRAGDKMPGLFQEGSGRFVFLLRTDGKARWIPCIENGTVLGKQESWQFRQRMLGQYPAERLLPSRSTFGKLADDCFASWRRATSTLETHHHVLRTHLKPLHRMKAQDITKHDIIRYVIQPMEKRGLAPNTIHQALMTASRVFEHGMDCEPRICRENPVKRLRAGEDKPERKSVTQSRVLTPAEFSLVLDKASRKHLRAAFALMGLAGLRPSEALGVQWQHVKWDEGVISVEGQLSRKREFVAAKTRASVGRVEMGQSLRKILLAEHMRRGRPDEGYVTLNTKYKPCGQRTLGHAFFLTCQRAGLVKPYPTPHDLRHTFASALIAQVGKGTLDIAYVSRQLRHENVQITLSTYAHEWQKIQKAGQAGDAIDEVFGPSLQTGTKMM